MLVPPEWLPSGVIRSNWPLPLEVSQEQNIENLPADKIISEIPNYERFGRKSKLRLTPSAMLDLKWEWTEDLHLDGIGLASTVKHLQVSKEATVEVDVHTIYVGSYISTGESSAMSL